MKILWDDGTTTPPGPDDTPAPDGNYRDELHRLATLCYLLECDELQDEQEALVLPAAIGEARRVLRSLESWYGEVSLVGGVCERCEERPGELINEINERLCPECTRKVQEAEEA
jgi:hypothetical protein